MKVTIRYVCQECPTILPITKTKVTIRYVCQECPTTKMKVTSYLGSQERDDVLDAIPQLSKLRRLILCVCSPKVWYKACRTNKEVEALITNSSSLEEVDVKLREADALLVKLYGSK